MSVITPTLLSEQGLEAPTDSFLREALDSLYEGIVIVDRDTTVLFANKAYMAILGVQPHHVLNRKLTEIEPTAKIIEVLRTGKPSVYEQAIEVQSIHKTVVASIKPLISGDTVVGAVSSFFDRTEFLSMVGQIERLSTINDHLEQELSSDQSLPAAFSALVGNSRKFKDQLSLAWRVAGTDSSVLLIGESGTGKELIARAIHEASKRNGQPYVPINCSAIPENLLESELFGYEGGSFTDARRGGKAGKIELADGGTLFLDEIGDLPLFMQPRLLRFLQEKECERIGSVRPKRVNVRVVAATNRNLDEMVGKDLFRKDLYYRINTFTLSIPPLRERKLDIIALIQHYLDEYNTKYGKSAVFSNECLEMFLEYGWPGNVRELQHVIEHAVVLADGRTIGVSDLPAYFLNLARNAQAMPRDITVHDVPAVDLHQTIAYVEKRAIIKALHECGGNRSKAIVSLGISRRSFYEKLKKYHISIPD